MLLRDVARQVFIIFISKYLIVLGRSLSTQHPIERKRDETIRTRLSGSQLHRYK